MNVFRLFSRRSRDFATVWWRRSVTGEGRAGFVGRGPVEFRMRMGSGKLPAVAGLAAAMFWPIVSAEAKVLAPHRALYEITLDRAHGGSGVTDMSGRMVYELTGSECEGYTQTMRFVTRMTNQEGSATLTDMRSSSFEDATGRNFRFSSSQYKDSKLSESINGDAARSGPRGDVKVELTRPEKKEMQLKPNVFFPIQHSIALLHAAEKGETVFQADLYDGSEKGEKVYTTTSYIGHVQPAGYNRKLEPAKNAERLDGLKAWPVSISYFEPGSEKQDAVPSYELAFLYFEDGVSRRLFIDYGEFSVRGTLKEITFLQPAKCGGQKK
jgi:envelope integrity protein B